MIDEYKKIIKKLEKLIPYWNFNYMRDMYFYDSYKQFYIDNFRICYGKLFYCDLLLTVPDGLVKQLEDKLKAFFKPKFESDIKESESRMSKYEKKIFEEVFNSLKKEFNK